MASGEIFGVESIDARLLALMRCVLAFAALIIIYIDPSEPARLVELTYLSLSLYCAYSAALAFMSFVAGWPSPSRFLHWLDVLFYVFLISLTEGTSSIFFHFFFFSILVASFSYGAREGLMVTAVSVVSFLVVGSASAPSGAEFELNRTLIRPVYLFALGFMMSQWGGYELLLKRRLKLLRDVSNVWHPRFGVDHTIGVNLDRLLEFYSADLCLLVLKRPADPPTHAMFTASPAKPAQAGESEEISAGTAKPLLSLPDTQAAAYRDVPRIWGGRKVECTAFDIHAPAHGASATEACAELAVLLDTSSFATVPYAQRDGARGRIYLASSRQAFSRTDLEFISQWAGSLSPVIENLQLMNELVEKALEHERYKISRDLHDTTIQPYIGLKLGLEALYRDAGPDNPATRKIGELIEMANLTIQDLRSYTATLRERAALPGDFLIAAVREQVQRYRRFYGIQVEVKTAINEQLTGRLAAEAYQIIVEGLSNVFRHTPSKKAYVNVLCEADVLLLKIGNDAADVANRPLAFTPRSIQERAQALNGAVMVEQDEHGYTVVHVMIPM